MKLKKINLTATIVLFFLEDVDIEKVLVSNKTSSAEKDYKYFIGYFYNDYKLKWLHIMLPKTSAYVKSCDGKTKGMYFLVEYDGLLEKYNTIWEKVSPDIKKEYDSEPVYKEKFLKAKIKSYGYEVTDSYEEDPRVDSDHTWLAVITLDSALNKDGNLLSTSIFKRL